MDHVGRLVALAPEGHRGEERAVGLYQQPVARALELQGLDLARSWLYSDSPADVPLFEAVGHPVVVNPKEAFRLIAEQRGWPVVKWKERNKEAQADLASEWSSWDG